MSRTVTAETVAARNAFNALANEVEGHLIRLLSEWQGRKAWRVSGHGGAAVALASAVDQYCASHGYNAPHTDSKTTPVWLSIYCQHGQLMANLRHLPSALRTDLYVGRVDDAGVLTGVGACHKRRTDYTVECVRDAHARAYRLECEARELRASVRDFD